MKNVLLTTTALVAFAGAAAAADVDFSWTGSASVEYDLAGTDGFTYDAVADANLTFTQELNSGAVASLALPGVAQWTEWDDLETDHIDDRPTWIAKLDTSYGSISFGDIDNAGLGFAEVAGMAVDVDGDGTDDAFAAGDIVFASGEHELRADSTLGGYAIAASTDGTDVAAQVSGSAGDLAFALFYETSAMGLNVSGAAAGVSFAVAYASNATDTSMGLGLGFDVSDAVSVSASYASNTGVAETAVGVAYAAGGITASADYDIDTPTLDLAAGYTAEVQAGMTVTLGVTIDDATGAATTGYTADVAYVMGDLAAYAGIDDASNMYAGVNYDLGGGASAYVYTADVADSGPLEWAVGTVAGIAMTF